MTREPELLVLDARGADPDAEIRALHARGPASRVDILGVTAWAVSEPTLLKRLLSSPDMSKDARQHWPLFAEVGGTWPLALWVSVKNMFTAYGGEHRRLRRLVAPAFAPRRVAALTGTVEALVSGLPDGLAATAPGEPVDLRERFAHPLPIQVISHLMGLPPDRREGFRGVVDGVFATTLTRSIWRSATVPTTAWGRRWPALRPSPPCGLSSHASPTWTSPYPRRSWSRCPRSSPTGTGICRYGCGPPSDGPQPPGGSPGRVGAPTPPARRGSWHRSLRGRRRPSQDDHAAAAHT